MSEGGKMITKVHRCTADLVKAFTEKTDDIYARNDYQEELRQKEVLAKYVGSEDAAILNCGMGAITTTIRALGIDGSILVAPAPYAALEGPGLILVSEVLYSRSKEFFEALLKEEAIPIQFINPAQYDWTAMPPNTSLIFLETIGNGFEMPVADIPTIMEKIKETNTLLIIDNTLLTPRLFNPIQIAKEKGVENKVLVIESGTKYYQKGADLITVGIVYGPRKIIEKIRKKRAILGTYLQPSCLADFPIEVGVIFEKTMPRHSWNALKIAQYLEQHPKVEKVYYPLLKSHLQYELAKKLFPDGCGGLFYFSLTGPGGVTRFADNLPHGYISSSFGFSNTRVLPLGALQNNGIVRVAAGFMDDIGNKVIDDFRKTLKYV